MYSGLAGVEHMHAVCTRTHIIHGKGCLSTSGEMHTPLKQRNLMHVHAHAHTQEAALTLHDY